MIPIWIIGVGRFGLLAAERLSESHPGYHLVLVDPNRHNLSQAKGINRTLHQMDGVLFVHRYLKESALPEWIVPALPVHLAAQWCLVERKTQGLKQIEIPLEVDRHAPNSSRDPTGNLYTTHASFRCPDTCDEPAETCMITQKKRNTDMFKLLSQINIGHFESLVIRSHQLGPGIGGYRPKQLFQLLDSVKPSENAVLISTACRCHGVVTAVGY